MRSYERDLPARVMGHENVGYIAAIGDAAARRWGPRPQTPIVGVQRPLVYLAWPFGHAFLSTDFAARNE